MKYVQIVAHTTGGEVTSAADQLTERDYEDMKAMLQSVASTGTYLSFNTDDGWAVIPNEQILYVEIKLS